MIINFEGTVLMQASESIAIQPFNAQEDTGVPFHRNFDSIWEGIIKKISNEHRVYESIDEKCLFQVVSQKTTKRIWYVKD